MTWKFPGSLPTNFHRRGSPDPARKGGLAAPLSGPIATLSDASAERTLQASAGDTKTLELLLEQLSVTEGLNLREGELTVTRKVSVMCVNGPLE